MDIGITYRIKPLIEKIKELTLNKIIPAEKIFFEELSTSKNRFSYTPKMINLLNNLKSEAKSQNLWNFWSSSSDYGCGLSTVEYAYLAEEMGKSKLGAEVFNCSAPDTGNMEVFIKFGSESHKKKWLNPLLNGEIRSSYCMSEPDVASSDATNMSLSAKKDGDNYILNGEKWWISGAGDPRCKVYIVMAKTGNDDMPKHSRHSMFVVNAKSKGIKILRPMEVFGHDDAPHGHMHISFSNVIVNKNDLLLEEGKGFLIAQGRLGPGRIHHCMRAIGQAEASLELMCKRGLSRIAFGKKIVELGSNYDIIADCRMEIEMARLLCLKTAWIMDNKSPKESAPWISKIKVIAPKVALKVVDEAMQIYGGQGISQDTPLASYWTHLRTLRFADGPDAVHRRQVARSELKKFVNTKI